MYTRIQTVKVKITHRHSSRHIFIPTHRYSSINSPVVTKHTNIPEEKEYEKDRRKTVRVCTHCDTEKCHKHHYCATLYSCFHSITCHLTLHDCSWPDLGVNRSKTWSKWLSRTGFSEKKKEGDFFELTINLNIDGVSITSRTHTHPSHSQTSRLLTSSSSLGVPVPRATQCMWGM